MAGDNDHPKKGGWLKKFNRLDELAIVVTMSTLIVDGL